MHCVAREWIVAVVVATAERMIKQGCKDADVCAIGDRRSVGARRRGNSRRELLAIVSESMMAVVIVI